MTTKLTFSLLAVSCLAMAPAFAQSSNAQEEDKSAKTRSVTGCLSAGDSANEFKLTQDDGSTWEIQSKDIIPFRVSPMLATLVARPFHKPNWIYEEKYDGIRILAYKEGNRVSLVSRNDKNRTKDFPDIVSAIANLSPGTLLLDGEIVV